MKLPISTPHLPWAAFVLGAALSLPACGPSDPEEAGFDALQAQDYGKAVKHLQAAMEKAEPGSEEHRQITVGHFQALAHVSAQECSSGFLKAIDAKTVTPTERDYETVASELMQVKAFSDAALVIDSGIKTYPDNKRLPDFMDKLITMSKQGDQAELASTLKGIGYGGGE